MGVVAKKAKIGDWGVDLRGLDRSVRPQDDFDEFGNGTWKRKTQIPKKEASWGLFYILRENSGKAIRGILDEISANSEVHKGSNEQKLRDFYKLAMNSRKLNRESILPLHEEFELIDSIKTRRDLVKEIARLHLYGINVFWDAGVFSDPSNTDKTILGIGQNGLSLPERGYYFDEDKKDIKEKFIKHVSNVFQLLDFSKKDAKIAASTVIGLEIELAKKSWNATELRDIASQLNYRKVSELEDLAPAVDWKLYFNELGTKDFAQLIVHQLDFMKKVNAVIKYSNLDVLKTYLKWWLIMRTADFLSDDFIEENFNFWDRVLNGNEKLKPRWQRASVIIGSQLGEILGQEYIKRYFSSEAKEKINELVDNILDVMKYRIKNLEWMTQATKIKALEKLNSFTTKLGYPDKWKDYSSLEIKKDAYVLNYLRAKKFHSLQNFDKLGKPTDRTEWHMTPSTVNAYYHPLHNEICFPAGILQPPFFDPWADDAVNYASIGAVIGHEITHGFDDQGSQFDKDGNFKNWWTTKDKKEFEARCKDIVGQFNNYEVLDGLFINGSLTQGENIADLGGLSIAYEAYLRSNMSTKLSVLDGFTNKQRFFLAFAQVWRGKAREEYLKQGLVNDPHSPMRFRVLGTLKNTPEFYEAFEVKEGDGMYIPPEERVRIW